MRYFELNFLKIITYNITKPKLKTSDLNTLADIIFLDLALTN